MRYTRRARAFSLIEVLIAVFVLALGLLGIGAVFPVVVRQQRMAQDAVQGVSAARSASAFLDANAHLNEESVGTPTSASNRRGWDIWLWDQKWAPIDRKSMSSKTWRAWARMDLDRSPTSAAFGALRVSSTATTQMVTIPMAQRLWPEPFTVGAQPQFVWDFVGRRVDDIPDGPFANDVSDDQLEIVVFVRRIDPGIKVTTPAQRRWNLTLSNVLTGTKVSARSRRAPVGADALGRPTYDGTDGAGSISYAEPFVVDVKEIGLSPDNQPDLRRIVLDRSATAAALRQAAQPGQKLVDNLGGVHTVVRAAEGSPNTLILEREVSTDLKRRLDNLNVPNRVQVIFMPQVPVAALVKRVQR